MKAMTIESAKTELTAAMQRIPWNGFTANGVTVMAVQSVRLTVLRDTGEMELVPEGYDWDTQMLTLSMPGLYDAFLNALQRGAEFDAVWIEGGEFFGEACKKQGASAAPVSGIRQHALDGVHLILPVWLDGMIQVKCFRREKKRLVEMPGDGELIQCRADEGVVGGLSHNGESEAALGADDKK